MEIWDFVGNPKLCWKSKVLLEIRNFIGNLKFYWKSEIVSEIRISTGNLKFNLKFERFWKFRVAVEIQNSSGTPNLLWDFSFCLESKILVDIRNCIEIRSVTGNLIIRGNLNFYLEPIIVRPFINISDALYFLWPKAQFVSILRRSKTISAQLSAPSLGGQHQTNNGWTSTISASMKDNTREITIHRCRSREGTYADFQVTFPKTDIPTPSYRQSFYD